MNILTNLLYWISTSLLIPVIISLLIAFIGALLMLGGFYGLYMNRLKFKYSMKILLKNLKNEEFQKVDLIKTSRANNMFAKHFDMMLDVNWHSIHAEKIVADFELQGEKDLEKAKTLMRVGPMLGLMGTLIPMGPALVGLASGDIASMAINMQVAFSTTVIGIFVGALGFFIQLIKRRWFIEDVNNLRYIYELSQKNRRTT